MANQSDKFKAKWGLDKLDEGSFLKSEIAKKQRVLERIAEALKDEEAMKQSGGIEEAAAVFSYSGMNIFAQSFANTVERMFREEAAPMIRDVVREVVQEEVRSVLKGLLRGQKELLEQEVALAMQKLTADDLEAVAQVASTAEAPAPIAVNPKAPKVESKRAGINAADTEKIVERLRQEEKMKLKDIVKEFPDINFGVNPTNKMLSVMRHNKNIKPLGYGVYAYQE